VEIHDTYILEDSTVEPTKHCMKKREEKRGNGNIMEGVNLFMYIVHRYGITQ
jgi:hypothetical protein